jgi:hypothetical protein
VGTSERKSRPARTRAPPEAGTSPASRKFGSARTRDTRGIAAEPTPLSSVRSDPPETRRDPTRDFDWPGIRGYLDERTLDALDLDDTELSARSFDNFLSDVRTGFSTETAGGLPLHAISIGEAPRELTATALMFDELWKRLSDSAGGAPLVVGAPTRTMLLACSAAAEDAVTALALVVENAWEAATPEERLSSRLLLWDDGWSLLDDIDEDASTEP